MPAAGGLGSWRQGQGGVRPGRQAGLDAGADKEARMGNSRRDWRMQAPSQPCTSRASLLVAGRRGRPAAPEQRRQPQVAQAARLRVHPQALAQLQHPRQLGPGIHQAAGAAPWQGMVWHASWVRGSQAPLRPQPPNSPPQAPCPAPAPAPAPAAAAAAARAAADPKRCAHPPVLLPYPQLVVAGGVEDGGEFGGQAAQSLLQRPQLIRHIARHSQHIVPARRPAQHGARQASTRHMTGQAGEGVRRKASSTMHALEPGGTAGSRLGSSGQAAVGRQRSSDENRRLDQQHACCPPESLAVQALAPGHVFGVIHVQVCDSQHPATQSQQRRDSW